MHYMAIILWAFWLRPSVRENYILLNISQEPLKQHAEILLGQPKEN